jgi:tRNA A37 threonylcarbamoyladenosine synthetase subunit TsaC/SUA5/YrdC
MEKQFYQYLAFNKDVPVGTLLRLGGYEWEVRACEKVYPSRKRSRAHKLQVVCSGAPDMKRTIPIDGRAFA